MQIFDRENVNLNLPPRITDPAWWQLINWIADPIDYQDRCRRKYGDVFTMHLNGLGSFVLIGNPQAIQEIFSQDSRSDGWKTVKKSHIKR